jgi:hypothetical protein
MTEKPPKEDSRKIWARVLSSVPHGLKVRTISVSGVGEIKEEASLDSRTCPPKSPTPGPFGPRH